MPKKTAAPPTSGHRYFVVLTMMGVAGWARTLVNKRLIEWIAPHPEGCQCRVIGQQAGQVTLCRERFDELVEKLAD